MNGSRGRNGLTLLARRGGWLRGGHVNPRGGPRRDRVQAAAEGAFDAVGVAAEGSGRTMIGTPSLNIHSGLLLATLWFYRFFVDAQCSVPVGLYETEDRSDFETGSGVNPEKRGDRKRSAVRASGCHFHHRPFLVRVSVGTALVRNGKSHEI